MQLQSLKTQTIDTFNVIIGFQNRPIDPEETRKQNIPEFLESEESKTLKLKQEEQGRNRLNFIEAGKKSRFHMELATGRTRIEDGVETIIPGVDVAKNTATSKTWDKKRTGLIGIMESCNEELKPLASAAKEKAKEILRAGPVYNDEIVDPETGTQAGPRQGEVIKTESELVDLKTKYAAKASIQALLEDGNYVDDFRGKTYHKKTGSTWAETVIDALNVKKPTGTKYTEELTENEKTEIADQKESERVAALTAEEKTSEFIVRTSALANQAQVMENELKFEGDSAYQSKAQAFYDTELAKLKTKYGVV